jgi:dolichyl-phosphate-mannose-protein mannosyltransferase
MLRWLPTVWLTFIAIRYAMTATKSVREPFNQGWDLQWAAVWLIFLLAIGVLLAVCKRRTVVRTFLVLLATFGLTILILSHTLEPALISIAVITVAAGFGEFVLQFVGLISRRSVIERAVVATCIGVGFLSLSQLFLASLGYFNSIASWVMLFGLGFPAYLGLRQLTASRIKEDVPDHAFLILPMGYLFFLNLIWAAAPEIQFDPLNVHLAIPRIYLQSNGIVNLPYIFHSYFAHLLDMVFGLCLALGGPLVPKFLVLFLGVLATCAVFSVARVLFNDEIGVWSALIFYSTPLVIWLSTSAYVDLPLVLFVMASIIAFLRWYETKNWIWLAVSGWSGGIAVGIKVSVLSIVLILPLLGTWSTRANARRALRLIFAYAIPMLIIAVPWYLLVYLQTGNPFFPFLNKIFRSPQWPIENTALNLTDFGLGTSLGALIRLPFRLTFNSDLFGEGLPRGAMGVAALLAFPMAATFLFRGSLLHRMILAVFALYVTVWVVTAQYGRYFLPVLPLAVMLGCSGFLKHPTQARWNRIVLFCCVAFQVAVASVLFWNIPQRFPLQQALGRETREVFLARALPGYNAAKFLNGVSKPGDNVLGVGVENLRFYLDAPLYTKTEVDLDRSPYGLGTFDGSDSLAARLTQNHFTYLLATRADLEKNGMFYSYLNPEFLNKFAVPVYSDSMVTAFRIQPSKDN